MTCGQSYGPQFLMECKQSARLKKLQITRFEPVSSGVCSNRSANCALYKNVLRINCPFLGLPHSAANIFLCQHFFNKRQLATIQYILRTLLPSTRFNTKVGSIVCFNEKIAHARL